MRIRLAPRATAFFASLLLGVFLLVTLTIVGGGYLIMGGSDDQRVRNESMEDSSRSIHGDVIDETDESIPSCVDEAYGEDRAYRVD